MLYASNRLPIFVILVFVAGLLATMIIILHPKSSYTANPKPSAESPLSAHSDLNVEKRCGKSQNSVWSEAFGVYYCQKPQEPQCQQRGFVSAGWDYKEGKWGGCMPAPLPICDQETPDLYWIQGAWECRPRCGGEHHGYDMGINEPKSEASLFMSGEYNSIDCASNCREGYTRIVFSPENVKCYSCPRESDWLDITQNLSRKCHSLPECRPDRIIVRNRKIGQRCFATSEIVADFWATAFDFAGISEDDSVGKFIGGLAASYNIPLIIKQSKQKGGYYWFMVNEKTIDTGRSPMHVCLGHDCFCEKNNNSGKCGLFGSSHSDYSLCKVYVWSTAEGLWFLMRADKEPSCIEAYDKVSSGELLQASYALSNGSQTSAGYKEYEGTDYPLRINKGRLTEITITARGLDGNTFVSALDNTGIIQYM